MNFIKKILGISKLETQLAKLKSETVGEDKPAPTHCGLFYSYFYDWDFTGDSQKERIEKLEKKLGHLEKYLKIELMKKESVTEYHRSKPKRLEKKRRSSCEED